MVDTQTKPDGVQLYVRVQVRPEPYSRIHAQLKNTEHKIYQTKSVSNNTKYICNTNIIVIQY